jgi:hypothetical protein
MSSEEIFEVKKGTPELRFVKMARSHPSPAS